MSGRGAAPDRHTVVFFHAHPDDEALLTAGTMAQAAAAGHRVVLVVATAGEAGLAASRYVAGERPLGDLRTDELRRSAEALGCAWVEVLGYADSGMDGQLGGRAAFARADTEAAARRLAELLLEERADVLTIYDPQGGYGHPDHVQVHRVGLRAAELAGTPVVLEATVDRAPLARVVRLLRLARPLVRGLQLPPVESAYTDRKRLTHRVDVRAFAAQKRAAMKAHASQASADAGTRTLGLLLRLPMPLFRLVVGHEWYVERGREPGRALAGDIFSSLRLPDGVRAC